MPRAEEVRFQWKINELLLFHLFIIFYKYGNLQDILTSIKLIAIANFRQHFQCIWHAYNAAYAQCEHIFYILNCATKNNTKYEKNFVLIFIISLCLPAGERGRGEERGFDIALPFKCIVNWIRASLIALRPATCATRVRLTRFRFRFRFISYIYILFLFISPSRL